MKQSLPSARCTLRIAIAFTTGALISVSVASMASFQYQGMPPAVVPGQSGSAGSTIYLQNPDIPASPAALSGFQEVSTIPGLVQKGAGIAWPCHGSGEGPLNTMLYRLLPAGWKLYAKPGTVLDLPTQYSCNGDPWTTPVDRMLRDQHLSGTLWWGYDILAIAPEAPAFPLPPRIQPGGPMLPATTTSTTVPLALPTPPAAVSADTKAAKPDPVAACHGSGTHLVAKQPAPDAPLTIGKNGQVIALGWKQHVIPLTRAVREGWQLALPKNPTPVQRRLGEAWIANGGVLRYPLPTK